MLKEKLDKTEYLQKHLYEKGFLITNADISEMGAYPFYGNWNTTYVDRYALHVYKGVKLYLRTFDKGTLFLIGHAYNPYTMDTDEDSILSSLSYAYGTEQFLSKINELTGIFFLGVISGDKIRFMLDASGMQYGCYGLINGKLFITSHMRLVGDICSLTMQDYARRLVNYRWYHYMMGNYMPGELTCYKELSRIIPNTYVSFDGGGFKVTRFYPNGEIHMCETEEEYQRVIQEAAGVLKNTMLLIAEKWKDPAISLTGGIDSNTTFSAAAGIYEKYKTFSYVSMFRESIDAEKAKQISERFHVPHKEYIVPSDNAAFPDYSLYKEIFEWNGGGIGSYKDDDVRKKITLINSNVCEIEVKSWISETIRAYAYKYFGREEFPASLSPRNYTSLYKIFLLNRRLVFETDRYFDQYIKNTELKQHLFNYDESDFFVWEMEHGGKCGLDIGVMKCCFDITIPYNNRKLLDTLLRVPLKDRLSDRHHLDLKKILNRELYDMNIRVVNLNETDRRKKLANFYFTINSFLPF